MFFLFLKVLESWVPFANSGQSERRLYFVYYLGIRADFSNIARDPRDSLVRSYVLARDGDLDGFCEVEAPRLVHGCTLCTFKRLGADFAKGTRDPSDYRVETKGNY